MVKIFKWQSGALFVAVLFCSIVWGYAGGISAFLGGSCYLIPSGLAMWLMSHFHRSKRYAAISFLWGEILKILLALLFLVLAVFAVPSLLWAPFLLSLILVGHVVFFMVWKLHYGK